MITLESLRYAASAVFAGFGVLFFLAGTLGMLRLPDFYARTHAATKCDTVGAGSLLLALVLYSDSGPAAVKIVLLAALVLVTSPSAGHALARAAHRTGLDPWRTWEDRDDS